MRPQEIATPLTRAAIFMVATVASDRTNEIRSLLGEVSGLTKAVGFRYPEDQLSCVIGIGSLLWDQLSPNERPAHLHPFIPVNGATHHAPSTPGDLFFHIRSQELGLCFELARLIKDRLPTGSEIVDEVQGFKYLDQRDLLGFVDGTENPDQSEAAEVAIIREEEPDFIGGSYVIVQKYLHDLKAWEALTTEDQERAVGRRKLENIELDDTIKPVNSHVALNNIRDTNDEELAIYRLNMPFGSLQDQSYGTYFIGYAKDVRITEQMLNNMFLGDPPGNHDRLLDFSTALTGTLFFCPSMQLLELLSDA
ncbi:Dyp-type peroxidase [Ferrimicrobium sp.]|uniref:Dyp-type peroxidase n=1 Tax=Ferrimicrobium sp. TaxID=2926050 RepID=UPI00260D1A66|nr:Dyp-type peroxidase [Ferrimicrobium sp.]